MMDIPEVMDSIALYYFPESWEKVNFIASCPKLAAWVRTLQLANLESYPHLGES